jgi:uncharacterized protein YfcZ (UPF0381/DUF406 family)
VESRVEGVERYVGEARAQAAKAAETVQRGVLAGVGAVLVARDGVVELRTKYSTPKKAERELQRFERRGRSAVNQIERDVKKARTRVERELRERRTAVERGTRDNRSRAGVAMSQAQNVLQSGVLAGTQVAAKVTERVAARA